MLTTHLNNLPYSKFILIEDSLEQRGKNILKYVVETHIKNSNQCIVRYFVLEDTYETAQTFLPHRNVQFYDFTSDVNGWLDSVPKDLSHTICNANNSGCIIVIDSLAQVILQHGIAYAYKILHGLLTDAGVMRIVTILHQDACEDFTETSKYFQHLSTLHIVLQSGFDLNRPRISYKLRKRGGKILNKIEEYTIERGILKMEEIKKPSVEALIKDLDKVLPESLSTFRIGLTDDEKRLRNEVVLPYLPKIEEVNEGKITYTLDEVDDWDEEDPDDDLDI